MTSNGCQLYTHSSHHAFLSRHLMFRSPAGSDVTVGPPEPVQLIIPRTPAHNLTTSAPHDVCASAILFSLRVLSLPTPAAAPSECSHSRIHFPFGSPASKRRLPSSRSTWIPPPHPNLLIRHSGRDQHDLADSPAPISAPPPNP